MFMRLRFAFTFAIGAAFFCSAAAHAADNTRYISITGNNANACTLAAPCRTMHKGISATPVGGELQILDTGFYGNNATVNKSMTISGNGHTVYLGVPITIDSADAVVALRGLTLDGQGTVSKSIDIVTATAVHIERCVIHDFAGDGIVSNAGGELYVADTTVRNNKNRGLVAGAAHLTIDNSRFENNNETGISFFGGGRATINRSVASGNTFLGIDVSTGVVTVNATVAAQNGFAGFSVSGNLGIMMIESSVANGNFRGLLSEGTARISNSTFTGNNIGIENDGVVETRQNNTVIGNSQNLVDNPLATFNGM